LFFGGLWTPPFPEKRFDFARFQANGSGIRDLNSPSSIEKDFARFHRALQQSKPMRKPKIEEVHRDIVALKVEFSNCSPEVKKDLAKLEQKLAKLNQEIRTEKLKSEPIALPTTDVAIMPAPKIDPTARKSSNNNNLPPPNTTSSPSIFAPVEVSPPPHAKLS
jgi:hypothetical protein